MLKITEEMRNEMVEVLKAQIVPAFAGSILMQIANLLGKLEVMEVPRPQKGSIEEAIAKEVKPLKKDAK